MLLIYLLVWIMMRVASFGATFFVSFFWWHRDIKSISIFSLLLLVLHGMITLLGIWLIGSLVGGILSIIIFVKFLDFEPMWALFAGFLFSILFTMFVAMLVTLITPSGWSSRTSIDVTNPDSWTEEERQAILDKMKVIWEE